LPIYFTAWRLLYSIHFDDESSRSLSETGQISTLCSVSFIFKATFTHFFIAGTSNNNNNNNGYIYRAPLCQQQATEVLKASKGPFIATQLNSTQLNCRRRSAMQLTQLQRTANQHEVG